MGLYGKVESALSGLEGHCKGGVKGWEGCCCSVDDTSGVYVDLNVY